VVYFRNLSKRDSTTKAKALEDLQAYVSSLSEPPEEGFLEAWVRSGPACTYCSPSNESRSPGQDVPAHID
jgi:hypothetical protein